MAKSRRRNKNAIARYFVPFGLKQACDITMVIGFIMLAVGWIVYKSTNVVMLIGLCLYIAGSAIAIYRSVRVMTSGINKRSPEYKSALVNVIIMSVIFVIAVIGLVFIFVGV